MQKEKCENAMWRNALDTEVKCLWRSAARARIRNRTNDALTGFNEERFFFHVYSYSAETCNDSFVEKLCTYSTNQWKINVQSSNKYKTVHPL